MANRISQTFSKLKRRREKALIGYLTAGFPAKASLKQLVPLLEEAGADILEIGVPFSDPIADGPTIQHASEIALKNGVTLPWILDSIRVLRRDGLQLPILLMSYSNPIFAMGIDRFFRKAKASGIDGVIIPDLVPEEGEPYAKAAKQSGLDLVYLVAPTTPNARIRWIAQQTHGFLYAVSLTGVTGEQQAVPEAVAQYLRTAKRLSPKPLAVGFGITTPDQARQIARYADGVIVGSALIRAIQSSKAPRFEAAAHFVRSLKGALHAA